MSVEIFVDSNFSGATSGVLEQGYSYIGDFWNDQISSIKVYSGTWEFFEHSNFQGRSFQLTPGEYPWVTEVWNDLISSFKPVGQDSPSGSSIGGMAQEILNAHNRYRAEVGVPPLQWSDSLAADAQPWADYLASLGGFTLIHSQAPGQGENLFVGGPSGAFGYTRMVDDWGYEQQSFVPGPFTGVGSDGNPTGHYTQMIWRSTTHVGCAIATSGDGNDFLVCRYSPQGNVDGQYVP
jgi:Cysteine-rich secretory protein family/Beta/Gamma crystallin